MNKAKPGPGYLILVGLAFMLSAPLWAQEYGSKYHFENAREAFREGEIAEETARLSYFASDIADYYELAAKNYKIALKETQSSFDNSEVLSESEIKERENIISESSRRIKICEIKHRDATYRQFYDNALRDYEVAQQAEESARFYTNPESRVDYYQIAVKNYDLAVKKAVRSIEEAEELSESEKYERERLMADCRERIEICQGRLDNAATDSTMETLRQQGHKYVIAGFNYAVANDKVSARYSWHEAARIYTEALSYTSDKAAQEVIKSKIKAVRKYLEYVE